MNSHWQLGQRLRQLYEDLVETTQIPASHDWESSLLRPGNEYFADLVKVVEDWLDDPPVAWDYENATRSGDNGQGSAWRFFQGIDQDIADMLGIVLVDGDCPGSSYLAAELRMDITEANDIAQECGYPLRFEQGAG